MVSNVPFKMAKNFCAARYTEALRHAWVLRAAALLQHAGKLRALSGHPQEGDYNLARGLHQLGFVHLAQPLYERCLEGEDRLSHTPSHFHAPSARLFFSRSRHQ